MADSILQALLLVAVCVAVFVVLLGTSPIWLLGISLVALALAFCAAIVHEFVRDAWLSVRRRVVGVRPAVPPAPDIGSGKRSVGRGWWL